MAGIKKTIDRVVVFYIILTGATILGLTLTGSSLLKSEMPGKAYLMSLSFAFILAGLYFLYGLREGKLSNADAKTELDVRIEAVAKLKDPTLVARIAKEDPHAKVRDTALHRLKELESSS